MVGWLCSSFARWAHRRMHFELRDQKHIEHAKALVRLVDDDRAAGLRPREKLWMIDAKRTTVAHVNSEGPEGLRAMHVFELLNGHKESIPPVGYCCTRQRT